MKATAVPFSILYVLASPGSAKLEDCSAPCTCKGRATVLARHLKSKLDSATQTASKNAEQAIKLTVATSAGGETKKFLAPVAAIALATIAKDAEASKDATPTITQAIETFTAVASHYGLVAKLAGEVAAAMDA
ncbi:uncharacterized protein TEOVI_000514800 [Trypanosoma equiperdum]|uniref:Trypanosome variant surface glycoprotein (A-type) n=1 Tax=Trypanosoma equiperdum TaxID=5694 RepID=A0A1G4HY49_TRYEQ|nr:hypothetical protein, conserved [Trypanosoma equiperdum]